MIKKDEQFADMIFRFLDAISNMDMYMSNIEKSEYNFLKNYTRIVAKQIRGQSVNIVDIGLLRRTCKDIINNIESLERIKEYMSYIHTELFEITKRP